MKSIGRVGGHPFSSGSTLTYFSKRKDINNENCSQGDNKQTCKTSSNEGGEGSYGEGLISHKENHEK